MKKIIVADTVREYAVMFAEKGEKATLKAWEKAEKTTDYVETVAVTLCLKALFARGDMTFIEAMFAEENVAKCFDSKYRHSFLPEGYRNLDSKQYQKWIEVELAENELASWWAFHNLPFLKDILDEVTDRILETQWYMSDAQIIYDTFVDEVRDTLHLEHTTTIIDVLVEDMVETLTNCLDVEKYGYDPEGSEAEVWKNFCRDSYGLSDILESVYTDFVNKIAEEIIDYCA